MADRIWDAQGLPNLINLIKWLNIDPVKWDPQIMVNSVKEIGNSLSEIWADEGHPHWQNLTDYTKTVRKERNYAEGPILQQSGGLKMATVDPLQRWVGTNQRYSIPPAYDYSSPTLFAGSIIGGLFVATVAGDKVINQYGGFSAMARTAYGSIESLGGSEGHLPARPFFYIPSNAADPMTFQLRKSFEDNWRKRINFR